MNEHKPSIIVEELISTPNWHSQSLFYVEPVLAKLIFKAYREIQHALGFRAVIAGTITFWCQIIMPKSSGPFPMPILMNLSPQVQIEAMVQDRVRCRLWNTSQSSRAPLQQIPSSFIGQVTFFCGTWAS